MRPATGTPEVDTSFTTDVDCAHVVTEALRARFGDDRIEGRISGVVVLAR